MAVSGTEGKAQDTNPLPRLQMHGKGSRKNVLPEARGKATVLKVRRDNGEVKGETTRKVSGMIQGVALSRFVCLPSRHPPRSTNLNVLSRR